MKKIISWVAGSFFRQAGRFLFFIVIGGLIFLLIQHNNIQFKWTDLLGIETVKADTWNTAVVRWQDTNGNNLPQYYGQYKNFNFDTAYVNNSFVIQNGIEYPQGTKGVLFSIYFRELRAKNEYICTQTYANSNDCFTWAEDNGQNLSFNIAYNNGYNEFNCYWYDNQFMVLQDNNNYVKALLYCPLPSNVQYKKITKLMFTGSVESYQSTVTTYSIGIDPTIMWDISGDSQISSSIDSQTQQQAQEHNETMSTITDTNTTSDSNSTATFFNETNTTSESALTSIVSAPIALINNLVVGSHDSICATLNGKQICLPSGDIIWNRGSGSGSSGYGHGGSGVHDNGHWFQGGTLEAFISFFNLVVGGFILYKCLLSLFNSVHKLLDPANSWVGVMKL